jgi:hypothetical protein
MVSVFELIKLITCFKNGAMGGRERERERERERRRGRG